MLKIELTDEQREQLAPYFQAVIDGKKEGKSTAIGAQIWPDGMVVKLFDNEKGKALSKALGGDFSKVHVSAGSRIGL